MMSLYIAYMYFTNSENNLKQLEDINALIKGYMWMC